jgi:hypothetical protein
MFTKRIQGGEMKVLFRLTPKILLETKNWSIAVWAACVKKNNFFSIFSFR